MKSILQQYKNTLNLPDTFKYPFINNTSMWEVTFLCPHLCHGLQADYLSSNKISQVSHAREHLVIRLIKKKPNYW